MQLNDGPAGVNQPKWLSARKGYILGGMRGGAPAVCLCLLGCGPAPSTAAPDAGSDAASSTGCGRLATCGATCVDLLTDDANCGGCGLACSTGCKAGRCVEELAFATVNEMATDGMHVFWSSGAIYPQGCGFPPCSALNAVSVAGGPTTPIFVADPDAIAAGPVIDGKNAYFILAHGNGSASLSSIPLSGGTPSTIRIGGARWSHGVRRRSGLLHRMA